jgi:hypothetical protein
MTEEHLTRYFLGPVTAAALVSKNSIARASHRQANEVKPNEREKKKA